MATLDTGSLNSLARKFFPKLLATVEKNRREALTRPLAIQEINTLLSMRQANKPLFESIEFFYSPEYKAAREQQVGPEELEKIQKYRSATPQEANLLYADIHAHEQKFEYTGGGQGD